MQHTYIRTYVHTYIHTYVQTSGWLWQSGWSGFGKGTFSVGDCIRIIAYLVIYTNFGRIAATAVHPLLPAILTITYTACNTK